MNGEWYQLEVLASRIGAATAIFTAAYGAYRLIKTSVMRVINISNRLQMISEQLTSNGGTSLRDAINRIEERQIRTEQRERAFLQTHPNIMFELDNDLMLAWANKVFLEKFETDTDLIQGYGWHNLIEENDRDRVIHQFKTAQTTVRNFSTVANFVIGGNLNQTIEMNLTATVMRNSNLKTSGFLITVKSESKMRKHRKHVPHDETGTIKRYNTGMSSKTRHARASHFKKGKAKHWRDPSAYEPAPGDATAETRPSKYTLKYRETYEESLLKRQTMIAEAAAASKSLNEKSKKSGIPVSILRAVYRRGVAAWRTGHRPGTTPQQWGHARVNSFITGGKTRTTADADLARRIRK